MIIVKIWGGLCNQMFQYAFGYALSHDKNEELCFDVEYYNKQPQYVDNRKLEIVGAFELPGYKTIERPKGVYFFQNRYISYITRRFNVFHCLLPDNVAYVKEKEHCYSSRLPYFEGRVNYYDGYWQTEKYFSKYSYEIRRIFTPNKNCILDVETFLSRYNIENTVAVHVRRGDQAGKISGYTDTQMIEYYFNAIEWFKSKMDNPVFIFLSDDIEWCKNIFKDYRDIIVYQDNKKWSAINDLICISRCRHGIMSASTFSWWGNWLRGTKDTIVIAPRGNYFNNEFLKDEWIRL